MINLLHIALVVLLVVDLSAASLAEAEGFHKIRSKRSIGGFFKRLFGRRKTGFQGTAQAQGNYNTQGSSYFPSYAAYPNLNPYQAASATYDPATGQYPSYGSFPAYSPYGSYAQASGAYPAYAMAPNYQANSGVGGGGGGGVDFHSILDQFVRQSGVSPQGDQETAASNIQSKGDTPVFSFKKLYSFPFYFNSDSQGHQGSNHHGGYNLQIPFMKRHIRRMAQDYVNRRQMRHNQKISRQMAANNPQAMVNQYLAQQWDQNPLTQYGNLRRAVTIPEGSEGALKSNYYFGNTGAAEKKSSERSPEPMTSEIGPSSPEHGQDGQAAGPSQAVGHQTVSLKSSYSAA